MTTEVEFADLPTGDVHVGSVVMGAGMNSVVALEQFGEDRDDDGVASHRATPDAGVDVTVWLFGELDRQLRSLHCIIHLDDERPDDAPDVQHDGSSVRSWLVRVFVAVTVTVSVVGGVRWRRGGGHGAPTLRGMVS